MKNLKKTPSIIIESKSTGHTIDYKWTPKIMEKIVDPIEGNENLETILNKIGHKASLALAAATLEWIYWRFKGLYPHAEDIKHRIEALWSSIENPENSDELVFDTEFDFQINGFVNGPVWVSLMSIRMIDQLYKKGSNFLQSELVGLILLARHTTPKKIFFDKWFETKATELSKLFPNQNAAIINDFEASMYDFSAEKVICREFFFDPTFEYSEEASEMALMEFTSNIDYKNNPYCIKQKQYANA